MWEEGVSRRSLLGGMFCAAAAAGGGAAAEAKDAAAGARQTQDAPGRSTARGPRVTKIEAFDITTEYEDWLHYPLQHFYGPSRRTVYLAHTDTGLVGLGEGGRESEETIKQYVGTNPFDWMGDEVSLPLGMAMYDLMGKTAGVPVYKLFGQKRRSWVPAGSWTVSCHPTRMAEAVRNYSRRGYTWLKYHLSPFENVFDQIEAMEKVAPAGFRIHLDFTMGGSDDSMPELLDRLSEHPIVGAFEDPLPEKDIEGYAALRKRAKRPIVYHHAPLGATHEVLQGAADIYMLGHARIGEAMRRAGLFAAADVPFMIQNVGGNITRALTLHMQAAFPTAHFHFHSDTETWKTDVVHERLEPIQGRIRVPESPGLGVTLDPAALERARTLQLPEQKKWILKTRFKDATRMYHLVDPAKNILLVRPDLAREITLSYAAPLSSEWWDDDGSAAFQQMRERLERERIVLEKETAK